MTGSGKAKASLIVHSILALSHASQSFYAYAAKQANNYSFKRIYQHRSDIYSKALENLKQIENQPIESSHLLYTGLINWYVEARQLFEKYDNYAFLEILQAHERQSVETMKEAISQLLDEPTCRSLAQLAAEVQVSHDEVTIFQQGWRAGLKAQQSPLA